MLEVAARPDIEWGVEALATGDAEMLVDALLMLNAFDNSGPTATSTPKPRGSSRIYLPCRTNRTGLTVQDAGPLGAHTGEAGTASGSIPSASTSSWAIPALLRA